MRGRIYRSVFKPDLKVGGYTVRVPVLPGCFTEGDTLAEAKRMTKEVIELWLSVAGPERGPEPCDAPVTVPARKGAALREGDAQSILRQAGTGGDELVRRALNRASQRGVSGTESHSTRVTIPGVA